jgi:hypothetical protein
MGIFDIFRGGKKKQAISNAAELLTEKLASGEFDVQIGMFADSEQSAIYDITSMASLAAYLDTLKEIADYIEDADSAHFADALSCIVLMVRTPLSEEKSFTSSFTSMIKSLKSALEKTKQKELFQEQAAQSVITLISFMEAKYSLGKADNEAVKKQLEIGCMLLADTVETLNNHISENGYPTETISGAALVLQELLSPFWSAESENNPIYFPEADFYDFLIGAFAGLDEYKDIFGKSAMLRELVRRYKDDLFAKQKLKVPLPVFPDFTLKEPRAVNVPLVIVVSLAAIAGFFFDIFLLAIGFDALLLLIMLTTFPARKKKYNTYLESHKKECDRLQQEYEDACNKIKDFYESLMNYFE